MRHSILDNECKWRVPFSMSQEVVVRTFRTGDIICAIGNDQLRNHERVFWKVNSIHFQRVVLTWRILDPGKGSLRHVRYQPSNERASARKTEQNQFARCQFWMLSTVRELIESREQRPTNPVLWHNIHILAFL